MSAADYPRVPIASVAEWRHWLHENHAQARGAWLVTPNASSGEPRLAYEVSIPEALVYGWIDSVAKPADAKHTMLLFTPRKPGSGWSRSNKERLAVLMKEGRMHPAGLAKVAAAKKDGSWTLLDGVEAMAAPPDLRKALGVAGMKKFHALTPGRKKEHLRMLVTAKRPETRARRLADVVRVVRG